MNKMLRLIAIGLVTLGFAAGCATTSEPETTVVSDDCQAAERGIADAKAAYKEADALGAAWRDTEKMIGEAEAALKAGDCTKAKTLAADAKSQGDMALNQYYLEKARFKYEQLKNTSGLTAEQQAMLAELEAALKANNGRLAYDLASKLEASLAAQRMVYSVMKGDSLWTIAGKSDVYADPYRWPLIYKANADKIKDADLIYPGQEFSIASNPTEAEVSAAVQHAKTRGAWSIGVVEESDTAYLAK